MMNRKMLAIASGIGRGLQMDPTGFTAGAGAAMSGTAESLDAIEARRQSVAESRADRESAMAEQRRIRKESREFQLDDEDRRRKERLEDEPTLEEKVSETEALEEARARARMKVSKEAMEIERGLRGKAHRVTGDAFGSLMQQYIDRFPKASGQAPKSFDGLAPTTPRIIDINF